MNWSRRFFSEMVGGWREREEGGRRGTERMHIKDGRVSDADAYR